MPPPATSKQQVLAALTAATPARNRHRPGRGEDEDGLGGLSMDQLAATAGVSRATLYRLFPGKEALFAELIRSFSPFEPIAAVLETMGDRPPAEVIPAIAQAMAAAMDGHIGLLLQLLLEVSRSASARHGGTDADQDAAPGMRTLPLVAGYLDQQMAAGRLGRMDPVLAMQALAGPIVMHLLMPASADSRSGAGHGVAVSLEGVVDELAGMWLSGGGGGLEPAVDGVQVLCSGRIALVSGRLVDRRA